MIELILGLILACQLMTIIILYAIYKDKEQ